MPQSFEQVLELIHQSRVVSKTLATAPTGLHTTF